MAEEYRFAACKLPIRQRQERGCRLTIKGCEGCPYLILVEERLGKSKSYVDQYGNDVPAAAIDEMWK
ncbi:MAG: hypothetical protein ACPL5F_01450 [Moorellaceae bacterium]